jgi:hypothetical protein
MMEPAGNAAAIQFLLEGDPVIRWQTMRDLQGADEPQWRAEQRRTLEQGWVRRTLELQHSDGTFGSYGRWTETVWTLLLLLDMGVPADTPGLEQAFDRIVERTMPKGETPSHTVLSKRMDLCHLGFWLRIGSYLRPHDPRLPFLIETIEKLKLADGAWNCHVRGKPNTKHSSFHTTFNILEGLRQARDSGVVSNDCYREHEQSALEFLLCHRMFRSDKTGEIIKERFLDLTFPSYWHYTVLRGLDFMRVTPEIRDDRAQEAIDRMVSRRKANGLWPVEKRIPGEVHFDMEKMGGDSRWNTLRVLRVMKAIAS